MAACVPVSAWPHEAGAGARDGAAREAGVGAQAVWLRAGEDPEHGAGLSGLGSQEATRRLRGADPARKAEGVGFRASRGSRLGGAGRGHLQGNGGAAGRWGGRRPLHRGSSHGDHTGCFRFLS